MATIYYRLIELGKKRIEDVPESIRPQVQAMIDAEQVEI
jgi:hypothetical protein